MKLYKILPHINLVISFMMLVLLVVNSINPMMTFLRGEVFEIALTAFIGIGLISSFTTILHNFKSENDK